jgi:hypothetical protein
MSDATFIQTGILKGNWEEDNYDPHVEATYDGVTYTYLVGSGSWMMLGKVFKAGDEVRFVDVSPSYLKLGKGEQEYKGPKYCALVCPYCDHWW